MTKKTALDLGADAGLGVFDPLQQFVHWVLQQGAALARSHRDMPGHWCTLVLFPLLDTLVTRIAKDIGFIAVQERLGLGDVVNICSSTDDGMDES